MKFVSLIPTADPVTREDAYLALSESGEVFFAKWHGAGGPDEGHLHWVEITSVNIERDAAKDEADRFCGGCGEGLKGPGAPVPHRPHRT